jgi:hypothetical protein
MRAATPTLLLASTLVATAVVYGSLPWGYFVGDDFLQLFSIIDADFVEYLLRPHGGHVLVTRNAIFALFHALFGVNAAPYFCAVLLTHLVNTFLLFRVLMSWTDSTPLATLGALLWGTCPAHAETLSWYSVYGQVLVGTILLVVLERGSRSERDATPLPKSIIVVWPLLLVIASTCFGVGIGVTLVAPIAFLFLLPISRTQLFTCLVFGAIALVTPTAYRALLVYHDQLVGSSRNAWQMAMSFAALDYHDRILSMFGHLISRGVSDLLLSFAQSARPFPSTATTTATVVYASVVVAAFAVAPARVRSRLLGLMVLVAGCYGIIAAGRATLIPAKQVAWSATVPRYHYVATLPLTIILTCCLAQLTTLPRRSPFLQHGILLVAVILAATLYVRAPPFLDPHRRARSETMQVVEQIRAAIAEAAPGDEVRIVNRRFMSVGVMLSNRLADFPGWAGIFVMFFPSNVVDGHRVYFVSDDPKLVATFAKGKRTHDLFVIGEI